jgi:plastocyanin
VLVDTLSTGHQIGLGLTGAVFIVFALVASFVLPRLRPDFPGPYFRPFVALCFVLFFGMMAAVEIFGAESKEPASAAEVQGATEPATTSAGTARTIQVTERDFKIELATNDIGEGKVTFEVKNAGPSPHNLAVSGPEVNNATTPTFPAGKTAKLTVTFVKGKYKLYCAVPGHEQLGMKVEVTVP